MTDSAKDRFPYRLAISEALANQRASPVRTAVAGLVAALAGALVVAMTALDVARIAADNDQLNLAGANLLLVQRSDGLKLDAARCDSLLTLDSVAAVGGVLSLERAIGSVERGVSFDVIRATPGYGVVAWPSLSGTSGAAGTRGTDRPLAGTRVAERLGIADRAVLAYSTTSADHLIEASAVGAGARFTDLDNSIVVPSPAIGGVAECWVEAQPGARANVEYLLLGWFDEPSRLLITPALVDQPAGSSPQERLRARISRWAPLVAVGFLGVFQCALWLARRSEIGLYSLAGLTGGRLAVMVVTDYLLTGAVPLSVGAMGAAVCLAPQLTDMVLTLTAWDCLRTAALAALIPLLVLALLRTVKPFDAIRGR